MNSICFLVGHKDNFVDINGGFIKEYHGIECERCLRGIFFDS